MKIAVILQVGMGSYLQQMFYYIAIHQSETILKKCSALFETSALVLKGLI